ncbi:Two-component response regulator-like aprr2 [Turnera subulata]|uniref:Two-component response regulator-like aprr2 n=1 Tax=Turnera subulata TaxID=218843 RepID=A0A9Q0F643_9ROSI|nr:Two-component response regulator-like aprr2 [Turnera subulata]
MVCTANDLSAWKDFPKGLRVLLLDQDSSSAAEIKLKLEAMDYVVSIFCNENEALSAISDKPESYHVAIVESEEVIDKVVKEAINKPWLPFPIGLKPPSTESVLFELSRQGISTIPPQHQRL